MVVLPAEAESRAGAGSWRDQRPSQLLTALRRGVLTATTAAGTEQYPVVVGVVGDVDVPDGRLVACDPYIAQSEEASFEQTVRVGTHPLAGAWAVVGPDHRRVAALVLIPGGTPVVRWELALRPGQDPSDLRGDEYFGFGVDAGTAFLGSPEAQRWVTRVFDEDEGMLEDPISEALEAARPAVLVFKAPGAGPRFAVSDSGWGDGTYPTWFGFDAAGEVSIVLVDFLLTDEGSTD